MRLHRQRPPAGKPKDLHSDRADTDKSRQRLLFDMLHATQLKIPAGMDPERYFCTMPHRDEIEDMPELDQILAKELFGPEFELSVTQHTVDVSGSAQRLYDAQRAFGASPNRKFRSNTVELVVVGINAGCNRPV